MLSNLNFLFNPYDRTARLRPALLCALPLFVSIFLLIPVIELVWSAIGGLVLFCGSTTLLTQFGRDRGKRLEPKLYEFWGGMPSVLLLRHSDTRIDNLTKARYRNFLESTVPNLNLASSVEEQSSPKQAALGYESATKWLLTKTRDREKFELLFRENMSYGFRRNIWALKPAALILDILAISIIAYQIFIPWTDDLTITIQAVNAEQWFAFAVIVAHSLIFLFLIGKGWVQIAADAYAYQLLAACDTLSIEQND